MAAAFWNLTNRVNLALHTPLEHPAIVASTGPHTHVNIAALDAYVGSVSKA